MVLQAGIGGIHINAHELAEQGGRALAVSQGIAPAAAVAQAEVKKPIRAEGQLSRFVIVKVADLVHGKQDALGSDIDLVGVGGRGGVFSDDRLDLPAHGANVVDIQFSVRGIVGMKGHAQQTHLAAGGDFAADVEEWSGQNGAVLDDFDSSSLLHNKKPAAAVVGLLKAQRRTEARHQQN